MNAMAGDNPDTATVTKVIWSGSEQTAKPGPMSVGEYNVAGQVHLAGLVEGLGFCSRVF
jgi:hypothetical protein